MHLLSPDSTFMRGLSTVVDAVRITLLILVASVPVVTFGVALTAAHYAARRSLAGAGHLTRDFVFAFRKNFSKGILLWLVFAVPLFALILMWLVIRSAVLLPLQIVATCIWMLGFEWVWALLARFENSWFGTLRNAFVFGLAKLPYTLILLLIDIGFLVLMYASFIWMPEGLFLLGLLGPGGIVMIRVPIIEYGLREYIRHG